MPTWCVYFHCPRHLIIFMVVLVLCIHVKIFGQYATYKKYWGKDPRALAYISRIEATRTITCSKNLSTTSPSIFRNINRDLLIGQHQPLGPIASPKNYTNLNSSPYGAFGIEMHSTWVHELIQEFDFHQMCMPADLVYGKDRRPSFPFISGDGFRSMCKHRCEEKGCAFSPDDVKSGDCVFIATTNLKTLRGTSQFIVDFSKMVDRIRNDFVVISHNGDLSSPDGDEWHGNEDDFYAEHHSHLLSHPKLRYWFASNCNWKDYPSAKPIKLVCIPMGIENRYNPIGKSPGNYFTLIQKRSQVVPTKRLLVAFTAHVFKPFRGPALAALTAPWISNLRLNRDAWLKAVQEHVFVACPSGHGYDTHRLWEVLLAGSIPVVETSPLDSMYEHLPVLIVSKWRDVDEAYLDEAYRQFLVRKDFQIDRIFFSFWKTLILNMSSI
jgi:hypothetical protein